jgi:plasmid stability protein
VVDSFPMKNITVTVPDEVYRRARIRAAEEGRSVSALVTEYLRGLAGRDAEFNRLEALQRRVQADITRFRGGDRLDRSRIHDRALR